MSISVQMIGHLRIRRGDTVLTASNLGGPKPRQILEILLLRLGTTVSKDQLVDLLWGGKAPGEALATLESYVSVLRRHLQPGHARTGPLRTANAGYLLERELVDLDLDRFDSLLRDAELAGPADAYPQLVEALELAAEPLLGDELTPEWAVEARDRHASMVTGARVLAAEAAAALDRADDAVRWAQQAVSAEPLNERAWSALVAGLEQAGRYAEGIRSYDRCRRLLDREMGCMPGPALRAAHARLLKATAQEDGELSEVLAALLLLSDSMRAGQDGPGVPVRAGIRRPGKNLQAAGQVVDSFLRRALASA
ncbi:response regulator receiver protein [Arthrobacter sp. E918]|uniref:Response regulator receiver protein n=2 Tax=Arthrobacter mobilis TaxID=2724944 RepID=A0A7X6K5B7_9MICC|nr:response regulator receiver protein [Arthrobacter mobilis]